MMEFWQSYATLDYSVYLVENYKYFGLWQTAGTDVKYVEK